MSDKKCEESIFRLYVNGNVLILKLKQNLFLLKRMRLSPAYLLFAKASKPLKNSLAVIKLKKVKLR